MLDHASLDSDGGTEMTMCTISTMRRNGCMLSVDWKWHTNEEVRGGGGKMYTIDEASLCAKIVTVTLQSGIYTILALKVPYTVYHSEHMWSQVWT